MRSGGMMKNIGDKVWTARLKHCEFKETCPDCLGTKAVTLLLANGDKETLECKTCYPGGFDPPRGYLIKTQYQPHAEQRIIESMEVRPGKITYRFYDWYCDEIFETKEEAEAFAEKLRIEREDEDHQIFLWKKEDSRRAWSWNCSYYRKQIKDAKSTLSYAEARLGRCVELAREHKTPYKVGA